MSSLVYTLYSELQHEQQHVTVGALYRATLISTVSLIEVYVNPP